MNLKFRTGDNSWSLYTGTEIPGRRWYLYLPYRLSEIPVSIDKYLTKAAGYSHSEPEIPQVTYEFLNLKRFQEAVEYLQTCGWQEFWLDEITGDPYYEMRDEATT